MSMKRSTWIYAAGGAALIGALVAVGLSMSATAAARAEAADAVSKVVMLESQLDSAREALKPQREVALALEDIESREERVANVADREDASVEKEAELERLEAELDKRSAAIDKKAEAASAAQEAWVAKVRECLARDGDYISANVTWTEYSGADFACYSG
jgi:biopolymer transport protein ExbB/TolQ